MLPSKPALHLGFKPLKSPCLPAEFYADSAVTVARLLLGAVLCRNSNGEVLRAKIVETECYTGQNDLASHGRSGQTPRNLPMWEDPGRAYVYRTYGIHWMLNVVTEPKGHPAAVLVRAVEPLSGQHVMQDLRPGRSILELTNGPGRLCQAMAITGEQNRIDLTTAAAGLYIEAGTLVLDQEVQIGPRIGIEQAAEPWLSIPWRFWIAGNQYVSRGSGRQK